MTDLGAVVTWFASGTSRQDFDIEEQGIGVLKLQGDLISHFELFDDVDLEPHSRRSTNSVDRRLGWKRGKPSASAIPRQFAAQNWAAMADMMADDHYSDDRRPVIGAGVRRGRIPRSRSPGNERGVVDTHPRRHRNSRRATSSLSRPGVRIRPADRGAAVELLVIVETDTDGRISAWLTFDPDDLEAASKNSTRVTSPARRRSTSRTGRPSRRPTGNDKASSAHRIRPG